MDPERPVSLVSAESPPPGAAEGDGPRIDGAGRSTRPRKPAKPLRVALIHNVDYDVDEGSFPVPQDDNGNRARAGIADVATEIARTLSDDTHVVTLIPVDGDLWRLRARLLSFGTDVVFNLCESLGGDARLESAVPMVLESLGLPYTGSPPSALSCALYKDRVKVLLARAGVPTPDAQVLYSPDELPRVPYPAIVKPTREDGSIGITSSSVVHDEASCRARVAEVIERFHQPVLVERYIKGREFNVALFGFPTARILPLSEIDFGRLPSHLPKIVSYEAKWDEGSVEDQGTVPITFPQLPPAVAARIRRTALEAFRALGARDYGRVDVRLADDGTPFVIDVNPNCDLSSNAGLARACAAVGIDYSAMMRLLVRYAHRRRREDGELLRAALAPFDADEAAEDAKPRPTQRLLFR